MKKLKRRRKKKMIIGKVKVPYEYITEQIKSLRGLEITTKDNGMLFFIVNSRKNREESEWLRNLVAEGIVKEIREEDFPISIRR